MIYPLNIQVYNQKQARLLIIYNNFVTLVPLFSGHLIA